MKLSLHKNQLYVTSNSTTGINLKNFITKETGLCYEQFYLIFNGKRVSDQSVIENGQVHVVLRCCGGKGGFGSMLRAIGAQIEKTTNREACRDLSGRRLRDINEEKRLKNWINQQAEREKEAKERKKKKLERLCEKPKHEFKDEQYDKERSDLPEVVENALNQGLQASTSSKRKATDKPNDSKQKKTKLWMDEDLDDLSSDSEDEESETEGSTKKLQKPTVDSEDSVQSSVVSEKLQGLLNDSEDPHSSSSSTSHLQVNEDEEISLQENENKEATVVKVKLQSTN